ncbi:IclR family transcriptional regulator [Pigmentiphaga sp. NML030171]|uniref:IclR family transcriptional regulator n=1 Tax=Pigmentiphaga sp. NML030171 TaxID=2008676 RepID=UPI001595C98F|nr:IclR family transcriptional regulator [Pigmentiphaga sp. NML030171]
MAIQAEGVEHYPSFERIVDIWLSFVTPGAVHSAQAIAREFGTSRSSTYRYLQILRERGLIEDVDGAGNYRLGSAFVNLVRSCEDPSTSASIAEPFVHELALASGETVLFTTRIGDRVICTVALESRQAVRVSVDPVRNVPLHLGSSAKVHLAYLEEQERTRVLPRLRAAKPGGKPFDPQALERSLAAIREQGYAISDGEIEAGVRSVSAPAFFPSGSLIGAITLAAPAFRLQDKVLKQAVLRVVAAARHISDAASATQSRRASAA